MNDYKELILNITKFFNATNENVVQDIEDMVNLEIKLAEVSFNL